MSQPNLERLTEDSRTLLHQALREALACGHNYIAPEHIERATRRRTMSQSATIIGSEEHLQAVAEAKATYQAAMFDAQSREAEAKASLTRAWSALRECVAEQVEERICDNEEAS